MRPILAEPETNLTPASSRRLRLLHVTPTYYPAVRYGGPIVTVHGLCKALAARGHEVHVFTTNVDGPGVSDTNRWTPKAEPSTPKRGLPPADTNTQALAQ